MRIGVALSSGVSCRALIAYRRGQSMVGGNMNIGIAGLGAMGAAIAARLIEVGHQVTVWNRTPDKTRPLASPAP